MLLNFKVSPQLKSIIGRDLITDDYVAIFELVKNSYDARATRVHIHFFSDSIYIVDNGKGMSFEDIENKWLYVAYSAKSDGTEDGENSAHHYAGSKGVGRFSCDRLGVNLAMMSRVLDGDVVSRLQVNWGAFEDSSVASFIDVKVQYDELSAFKTPKSVVPPEASGTVLKIYELRDTWSRERILSLKNSLSKLINPFNSSSESFGIDFHCIEQLAEDERLISHFEDELPPNTIVNSAVENFIFETLQQKTTWLSTKILDGMVVSELIDRGEILYKVSEPNPYTQLEGTGFECNLFYLNRSAKSTFARRMGISSVSFGSVFLFKNGFRVYPVGDEADDTFGIARRKQQGTSRYLGSRDLLGRIDVHGDEAKFKESSSRDKGLIETSAYEELLECFKRKCLYRLENYVVGVTWKFKFDNDLEDASFLEGHEARAKALQVLSKLTNVPDIKVDFFNKDLFGILSDNISDFPRAMNDLVALADKVGDEGLRIKAMDAFNKFQALQASEAEAIRYAEREREARHLAEKVVAKTKKALETERSKNLFLTSLKSRDKDTLENLHHQVIIYAISAHHRLEGTIADVRDGIELDRVELERSLGNLMLLNKKIIAASRFATSANFKLNSSKITEDFTKYLVEYIEKICPIYIQRIRAEVCSDSKIFELEFFPIEVSIMIDNLIENSKKANASVVKFDIKQVSSNTLEIRVEDDGDGISQEIDEVSQIFEKGITTTDGSGLGLYHVTEVLQALKGTISVIAGNSLPGASFLIRVNK